MEIEFTQSELVLLKRLLQDRVNTLQSNTTNSHASDSRSNAMPPKVQNMAGAVLQSVSRKIIEALKEDA